MAEGLVPSLHRKGFNTLVILVAWWIWKHINACVFDGVSPNTVLRNDSLIRVDNHDNNVYLALCADDGGWCGIRRLLSGMEQDE